MKQGIYIFRDSIDFEPPPSQDDTDGCVMSTTEVVMTARAALAYLSNLSRCSS